MKIAGRPWHTACGWGENLDMMKISSLLRRPHAGSRFGSAIVLGLATVAAGMAVPGNGDGTAAAQASGPCALLTTDEIQPLALKVSVASGVPLSLEAGGFSSCRYMWGTGTERYSLDVAVSDASRAFSGMMPDQIRKELLASVTAGTADAIIPDVGEAAVFKADSAIYVRATAYLKSRILQVRVDGLDAREKKDQVIALLKSAAARL